MKKQDGVALIDKRPSTNKDGALNIFVPTIAVFEAVIFFSEVHNHSLIKLQDNFTVSYRFATNWTVLHGYINPGNIGWSVMHTFFN